MCSGGAQDRLLRNGRWVAGVSAEIARQRDFTTGALVSEVKVTLLVPNLPLASPFDQPRRANLLRRREADVAVNTTTVVRAASSHPVPLCWLFCQAVGAVRMAAADGVGVH